MVEMIIYVKVGKLGEEGEGKRRDKYGKLNAYGGKKPIIDQLLR